MLVARNIRAFSLEPDSITLSWEIEPTTEDLSTYTITVLRSQSAVGPYDPVSIPMNAQDIDEFQDRGVNLLSKWREYYYRLLVSGSTGSQEYGSTPYKDVLLGEDPGGIFLEGPPDIEALEAIRRFDLVLREYAGRRVLVLNRRTWGQHCEQCWDALKRRSRVSQCQTCYATGFAGGYLFPKEARCLKPPHEQMVALTPLFVMEPKDVIMWFNSSPRLKPDDLVIDIHGDRWRVIRIHRSEKSWALTRQTVQMRALSRDQIEYKLPVSPEMWPVNNMTTAPHRQYIRATDIESYHKAAQDLGVAEQTPNIIKGFPTHQEEG